MTTLQTINRRGFLKSAAAVALSFALAPCLASAQSPNTEGKPNFVIILTDDMGYADVPGFGADKEIPMPNLDRLRREGMLFSDAYVTGPICVPSRMGLMSGRHQARSGVYTNVYPQPGMGEMAFRRFQEERLMPSFLKEAGYATAMFGKWHLSGNHSLDKRSENELPDSKGWDEIVIIPGGMDQFWAGTRLYHKGGEIKPAPEYLTDHFGKLSADFIARKKAETFFLYLAFSSPHAPLHAEDEDIAAFGSLDGYDRKRYTPRLEVEDRQPKMDRQVYAGMMRAVDRNVGRVLDALDAAGVADNTLVIFLNDNGGPALNATWHSYNQACNAPLRGYKFDCLEGGIRTPMLARWPGKIPAGEKFSGVISSMDYLPTFLTAAGVPLPTDRPLDGVNLLPFLFGETKGDPHEALYWQNMWANRVQAAIRSGKWKLHKPVSGLTSEIHAKRSWELYDLETDPGESRNLAAEHPELVKQLADQWSKWRSEMEDNDGVKWR